MDDFLRRRELITDTGKKESSNIIYHAENLTFRGRNYVNTGFKPFSYEEYLKVLHGENDGFEMEFWIDNVIPTPEKTLEANFMFFACRVEDGSAYPGFYIKANNLKGSYSLSQVQIGKFNYVSIPISRIYGHPFVIRKRSVGMGGQKNGWQAKDYLGTIYTFDISDNSTFFDQPIIIGATIDPDGKASRFGNFGLKYITIKYIPIGGGGTW